MFNIKYKSINEYFIKEILRYPDDFYNISISNYYIDINRVYDNNLKIEDGLKYIISNKETLKELKKLGINNILGFYLTLRDFFKNEFTNTIKGIPLTDNPDPFFKSMYTSISKYTNIHEINKTNFNFFNYFISKILKLNKGNGYFSINVFKPTNITINSYVNMDKLSKELINFTENSYIKNLIKQSNYEIDYNLFYNKHLLSDTKYTYIIFFKNILIPLNILYETIDNPLENITNILRYVVINSITKEIIEFDFYKNTNISKFYSTRLNPINIEYYKQDKIFFKNIGFELSVILNTFIFFLKIIKNENIIPDIQQNYKYDYLKENDLSLHFSFLNEISITIINIEGKEIKLELNKLILYSICFWYITKLENQIRNRNDDIRNFTILYIEYFEIFFYNYFKENIDKIKNKEFLDKCLNERFLLTKLKIENRYEELFFTSEFLNRNNINNVIKNLSNLILETKLIHNNFIYNNLI